MAMGVFVGVDLASEPRRTGLAVLREHEDGARIEDVRVGADDGDLIAAITHASKAGVDVPFGWPSRFIDVVSAHRADALPAPPDTGPDWRRSVLFRETDREVHRLVGKTPLSVAADKIASPAIRWAGIVAALREQGLATPRDGTGVACEVYPGAALAAWGFGAPRYKRAGGALVRGELVEQLAARWPWLDWTGHRDECTASDDALDAVIAAVVAREVHHERAVPPPAHLSWAATEEGWIWLPRPG
ncbi:DUF429 domain-containing protein [Brachybacterium sp. NPDC056505]|uniref:DUF429 domain-containing protein n=1 Tax=Brachybacterium sp. NPDC056505 TaxID=3345843 RepID=UPI00366DDA2B